MEPTPDELAGTVDGFGGLTRAELHRAVDDLAARTGTAVAPDALEAAVDDAIERYYLLELDPAVAVADPAGRRIDAPVLVAGPAALPALPAGGDDLPHLLEIDPRPIDRQTVAAAVEADLRADAARAIDASAVDRAERLLDACYAVEAWGPVDLADAKAGLADLVE